MKIHNKRRPKVNANTRQELGRKSTNELWSVVTSNTNHHEIIARLRIRKANERQKKKLKGKKKNIKREIIHINIFCFILYAYNKLYACPLYDCVYFFVNCNVIRRTEKKYAMKAKVGVTSTQFLYLFACLEYPLLKYFSL